MALFNFFNERLCQGVRVTDIFVENLVDFVTLAGRNEVFLEVNEKLLYRCFKIDIFGSICSLLKRIAELCQ
ncbi:hypothetical protein C462_16236 [Halorubrum distributum JCM 13916]|uniref:Uncharacterized protein n=1 Tax=Halorubrum distributum JCM 13916 TaxID=1230455 RepID=M0P8M0_9EURY|nr:hypothetical protein C462_16236 [Halorubrum arcis JCM 13916]